MLDSVAHILFVYLTQMHKTDSFMNLADFYLLLEFSSKLIQLVDQSLLFSSSS